MFSSRWRVCSPHSQRETCCKWHCFISARPGVWMHSSLSLRQITLILHVFVGQRIWSEVRAPRTRTRPHSLNTTTIISWRYGQTYLILMLSCHLWEIHHSCLFLLCSYLQYLSYCMTLCPRAYSDEELLLLLTVVNKVSLDARLILQPSVELFPVQYKILYSIRNWAAMVSSHVSLPSLAGGSDAKK